MRLSLRRTEPLLADVLSLILPTQEQTLLLRACLHSGESGRRAWKQWRKLRRDAGIGFIAEDQSIKSIRPLLSGTVQQKSLPLDRDSATYLRAAYLREELRCKIFRGICRNALRALENRSLPAVVCGGTALAETVYRDPVLRHCHGIDLLVKAQDLSRIVNALAPLGFTASPPNAGGGKSSFKLVHQSGLPLELHTHLFQEPYPDLPLGEVWARTEIHSLAGASGRILAPSDSLLQVCGGIFHSGGVRRLRWISDAWFLIERRPDMDWELLLDNANRTWMQLPLAVMLAYLAEQLQATVPPAFLTSLFAAASRSGPFERELALAAVRSVAEGGLRSVLQKTMGWRSRALVVRWMLFPSPAYLRWSRSFQCRWLLPFYYAHRPLSYTGRRLRSALTKPSLTQHPCRTRRSAP